ncbi:MAG: phosphoglucomutase [Treponema sp.]|nr:phosphoglucomutase [Treponema sp.]
MITSASGWRKVFAESGDENDTNGEIGQKNRIIAALAAETFAEYILSKNKSPFIALGMDTRPTGPAIANIMLRVFDAKKVAVSYTGIIASPEIMAYSHSVDAFVYISASHNPIGHNGIKFGLNDGGVLNGEENAKLVAVFEQKCHSPDALEHAKSLIESASDIDLDWVFAESVASKRTSLTVYRNFAKEVISGTDYIPKQNAFFARLRQAIISNPISIICDMNGSARTMSIDSSFLDECGITFNTIYGKPGQIAHGIIPEPENLIWCAKEMENRHAHGDEHCILGYMPDCDGDRGNIVYWDELEEKAKVLKAQEVFALSVLSEVAFSVYSAAPAELHGLVNKAEQFLQQENLNKIGVAVNGPTSMRIDEIAESFGAKVFRAEVGEANVVNLAREKRAEGYEVRILGEGSNGGNITHPSAVRDPICTIFALVKLLALRDETIAGTEHKGLFHLWCDASGQSDKYKENFTLRDIIQTLPKYTTTGVSEKRAVLHIKTESHAALKAKFQKIFEREWAQKKDSFAGRCGICSYEAVITNGTKETRNVDDYSKSGKGGLKIIFKDKEGAPLAFIWMRGSGTEPVFRIMCDVKGDNPQQEAELLEWETNMLMEADNI